MPNQFVAKAATTMPKNDREWQAFVVRILGFVTDKLDKNGNIEDDMKIASRDEEVVNIVTNLDGSGNAKDTLKIATRDEAIVDIVGKLDGSGFIKDEMELSSRIGEPLKDIVANLDSSGNIDATMQVASRGVAVETLLQRISDDGDISDSMKLETRDIALITVLQYINDVGRALNSNAVNPCNVANVGALISGGSPLTATDAGSDATINIASFDMRYDFGNVTYNSGSITALAYSTKYYVYAEDTDYTGGAVTYLATTTDSTITTDPDYIYVGTITTPAAAAADTNGSGGGGYFVQ